MDAARPEKSIISRGHVEYKEWLQKVGACFSPLTCSGTAHSVGDWTSWTVEGLYQGLKRIRVFELSLVKGRSDVRLVATESDCHIVHLPDIMVVRENLIQHRLFKVLKSGKRYNAKRNRYFGVLSSDKRNWEFTDTWLHPESGETLTRTQFSQIVNKPVMRTHLSQFPMEVERLRVAWANGEHLITDAMMRAHEHLRTVSDFVRNSHGTGSPDDLETGATFRRFLR